MDDSYSEMDETQEDRGPVEEMPRMRRRKETTMERRLVLFRNAEQLAHFIVKDLKVQPHELCLLREMTELILSGRY